MANFIIGFDKAFKAATANAENFDSEGYINWNFVDADICMDLQEAGIEFDQDLYNEEFEVSAREWIEWNENVYAAAV